MKNAKTQISIFNECRKCKNSILISKENTCKECINKQSEMETENMLNCENTTTRRNQVVELTNKRGNEEKQNE